MSDITYIRQKYKEITENAKADDVQILEMRQVVKSYEKGRADAYLENMISDCVGAESIEKYKRLIELFEGTTDSMREAIIKILEVTQIE